MSRQREMAFPGAENPGDVWTRIPERHRRDVIAIWARLVASAVRGKSAPSAAAPLLTEDSGSQNQS